VRPYVSVQSALLQAFLEVEASDCPLRTGAYQHGGIGRLLSKSIEAGG
jgi:hypothetical protein